MYVSKIQRTLVVEELHWKSKETQIQFGEFTETAKLENVRIRK
jgi:hypothetical protein